MIVIIEFVTTITPLPLVQRSSELSLSRFSSTSFTKANFIFIHIGFCCVSSSARLVHSISFYSVRFFSLRNSATPFSVLPYHTVIMHSSTVSLISHTFDLKNYKCTSVVSIHTVHTPREFLTKKVSVT